VVAARGSGPRPGKRLTPDTGSEDGYEDDDDVEEEGEEEKDDEDEDGEDGHLRGGVKGKADEEEARSSDERLLRRRRRRRGQLYTPEEEQAVVQKFDRKLVVFVALLYLLSFLDRSSMFTRFHPPMVHLKLTDCRHW
jgi:hypothetical protein